MSKEGPTKAEWKGFLTGEMRGLDRSRRFFARIRSTPRCKLCAKDFTALGDAVNATSRLSGLAAAGELLVSAAAERRRSTPTSPPRPDDALVASRPPKGSIPERASSSLRPRGPVASAAEAAGETFVDRQDG